jgi:hypothetical protein
VRGLRGAETRGRRRHLLVRGARVTVGALLFSRAGEVVFAALIRRVAGNAGPWRRVWPPPGLLEIGARRAPTPTRQASTTLLCGLLEGVGPFLLGAGQSRRQPRWEAFELGSLLALEEGFLRRWDGLRSR